MAQERAMAAQFGTLQREHLDDLIGTVRNLGFRIIAPTLHDDAICLEEIASSSDLPCGVHDKQTPGAYRLKKSRDKALFGYNVSPHSWKNFLHIPAEEIAVAEKGKNGLAMNAPVPVAPPTAFLGVRSCELAAMATQDTILMHGPYADANYIARRKATLVIAVNCGQAAENCFCVSMKTGPKVEAGYDLALTEVLSGDKHYFLVETGSDAGRRIAGKLPLKTATKEELAEAGAVWAKAASQVTKTVNTDGLPELLAAATENPHWDEVAARCLTCGACTMACPTCFCMTTEDSASLDGNRANRVRRLDSCFSIDFSYIHGGSIRQSVKSRYRQWLTHKLSSWVEQFGTFGCCGCGRCITWCPVGIDITAEAAAIRAKASR